MSHDQHNWGSSLVTSLATAAGLLAHTAAGLLGQITTAILVAVFGELARRAVGLVWKERGRKE